MYGTLRAQERARLADVIPLATPFMIRVDPCNLCNFRCQYCPTAYPELLQQVGRPKGVMPFELFQKIVFDLKEFPQKLKLYLYKDGEPLINKSLPEMIAFAKSAGVAHEIWTTTNGYLLRPELNRRLVESGLDTIKISVQGVSSRAYREVAKVNVDYDSFRRNVADLWEHRGQLRIHIKIVDTGLSAEERNKFLADFEPIADLVHIDSLMGWSVSSIKDFTLGTHPSTGPDGMPLQDRQVCPFPFYTLSVNVDGTVSVCCVDWAHATVVGDLRVQSLKSVWDGASLRQFRIMHLAGNRKKNKACGDCQYIQTLPDNIDADAARLHERLVRLERPTSVIDS